jgi:small basic protein
VAAYTFAQLEAFALGAGFPPNIAPIMAGIALAESGGRADAVQAGQPYGTTGWGLWQITPGNSVPQFGTDQQMLNPVNNAKAAYAKWSGAGANVAALRSQWTTYSSGAYLKFMPANIPPPDAAGAAQGAADQGVTNLGSGIPGVPDPAKAAADAVTAGVAAVFGPFMTSLEHMFDVIVNNTLFVAILAAGLGCVGVGVVLMLKESPAGTTVVNAVGSAAKVAGKVLK